MPSKILVVEDDRRVRDVIRWALEDDGLEVEVAEDGQQATDQARLRRPDLVVLDMALPVRDGYAVAAELRAMYGQAVGILVTTADGRAAEKARQVGAFAYLHKPFDLDDLLSLVRRGLGQP